MPLYRPDMAVFFMSRTKTTQKWTLASVALTDAYTDFILSRQAKLCTPATLAFYKYTAGVFLAWIEQRGTTSPTEITARHVREYLAHLASEGKADTTLHDHARAIRTLLKFWHAEKYIAEAVTFDMPKLSKKRLLVLNADQLRQIVKACNVRDRAIVLFMADSGLRRGEVCALNWGDVDMQS
jgi:integrase/recombinase XerC